MKTGFIFNNGSSTLTVLSFTAKGQDNLALLIRQDGTFVTARNISQEANGSFTWAFGHYFEGIRNALADFDERKLSF